MDRQIEMERLVILCKVPPRAARALVLLASGLDERAIAREMGVTLGAVRDHLTRARAHVDARGGVLPDTRRRAVALMEGAGEAETPDEHSDVLIHELRVTDRPGSRVNRAEVRRFVRTGVLPGEGPVKEML